MSLCVLAVLATGLMACGVGGPTSIDAADVGTITVRFSDSSVPPQFHRSWSITVADGSYDASVDSYGDPEATATGSVDDATITAFLDALVDMGRAPDGDGVDCTGGTSYYFEVVNNADLPIYETFSPRGCGDDARSWNSKASSVAKVLSSAVNLGPLYDEVDAAFDE